VTSLGNVYDKQVITEQTSGEAKIRRYFLPLH